MLCIHLLFPLFNRPIETVCDFIYILYFEYEFQETTILGTPQRTGSNPDLGLAYLAVTSILHFFTSCMVLQFLATTLSCST